VERSQEDTPTTLAGSPSSQSLALSLPALATVNLPQKPMSLVHPPRARRPTIATWRPRDTFTSRWRQPVVVETATGGRSCDPRRQCERRARWPHDNHL